MNIIVKVCLSDFKAKWTTGSVQYRPVVAQIDFSQMHAHAGTQTLTHTVHSQSVSRSTHSYSHCLTIHVCRVHSTNCVYVCVFLCRASSLQDATAMSRQWSTPTHFLFILLLPIQLFISAFSFLPLRLHLSPYHYIANFTSSVSHTHAHTLSHILQWQWTYM